jgi:hypothetical protein
MTNSEVQEGHHPQLRFSMGKLVQFYIECKQV